MALVALLAAGCAVQFISRYDEHVDSAATELQKEMDAFLTRLDALPVDEASIAKHRSFYDHYLVELRALQVRAHAHPKNRLTEEQLTLMVGNLGLLRQQHEAGPLSGDVISINRNLFNQAWGAIIALEVAKPRLQKDQE